MRRLRGVMGRLYPGGGVLSRLAEARHPSLGGKGEEGKSRGKRAQPSVFSPFLLSYPFPLREGWRASARRDRTLWAVLQHRKQGAGDNAVRRCDGHLAGGRAGRDGHGNVGIGDDFEPGGLAPELHGGCPVKPAPVICTNLPGLPCVGDRPAKVTLGVPSVNAARRVAAPPGVTTRTGPLTAPLGTTAVIWLSELTVKLAGTRLNETEVAPVKPAPPICTREPAGARDGQRHLRRGADA